MGNWYTSRDAVLRALGEQAPKGEQQKVLDQKIEAASREIDGLTHTRFIPLTATRNYSWPQRDSHRGSVLYLRENLLAVTALTREGDDVVAIASTDYFLEPSDYGPPYSRIEIDLASAAFFASKDTHQRAVRVTGRWGYSEDTVSAGTIAEADDGSETALDVSDSSLIGIGDTLLLGTEQLFVRDRALLTTGTTLNDTLAGQKSDTLVTLASGPAVNEGEIITIDSERMLIESIAGNDLTVVRAYDGSTIAAHSTGATVYAPRTLTVDRAQNGTTAASHSSGAALSRYVAPADVVNLCEALAIFEYVQSRGGRTGVVGAGEGAVEISGRTLQRLRDGIRKRYLFHVLGAV